MRRALLAVALAASLPSVAFAGGEPERVDRLSTETATEAGDEQREVRIDLDFSDDLELPPEILERLSDEQLHELLQARAVQRSSYPEIVVPLAFFGTVIGITALVIVFRHRRERLRHETIRLSIERGHPISPELLVPGRSSALKRGLLLIGTGVGLALAIAGTGDSDGWAVGMLPITIGAAYLSIWWLEERGGADRADGTGRRPPLDEGL